MRESIPVTLVLGLAIILAANVFLFLDVVWRGGAIIPYEDPIPAEAAVARIARWISVSTTPICWSGLLLILDGVLNRLSKKSSESCDNPIRKRPWRFALCYFSSVPIWLGFDWVNFGFLNAWEYHGLPENTLHRYAGYFFAFAAILPAMFLFAQIYQCFGVGRLRGKHMPIPPYGQGIVFGIGILLCVFTFVAQAPLGAITLWLAPLLLLDPLNHWLGMPSLIGDWRHGRYGRTFALMAGGMTCGLLWEFWNFWAAAKWTYNLPFLGPLEGFRLFEMPIVGFFGFAFFALECWVIFQLVVFLFEKLHRHPLDALPNDSVPL